jgi:hypothetical protein
MKIPGFTADLALQRKEHYYQIAALSTVDQDGIFPTQYGDIPAPDGPGFPGGIPGMPDIPLIPRHRICFYPCSRICFWVRPWHWVCFYPCQRICVWV